MATHRETGRRKTALVQHLRDELGSGALTPGEMLPPVRHLAEQFGLSRRSVHDQLHMLSAEGWLHSVPRVGIFVRSVQAERPARRFLDHAIVVLTASAQPNPAHRQSGWLDHVSAGALHEIHRRGLHGVMLHPERVCDESIECLARDNPLGAVIPETEDALSYAEMLRAHGVRVVTGGDDPAFAGFDRVASDHAHGAHALTRWLLQQGRRHIRMLWMVNPEIYWSRERESGYRNALCEAGHKPWPMLDISAAMQCPDPHAALIEAGVQALRPLFEPDAQGQPLDALLVPSDGYVSEADAACRRLGKVPGRDVLIVGYDNYWQDIEACGYPFARPAATVDKRHPEMGAAMVTLLLERAEQADASGQSDASTSRRIITPRLVPVS